MEVIIWRSSTKVDPDSTNPVNIQTWLNDHSLLACQVSAPRHNYFVFWYTLPDLESGVVGGIGSGDINRHESTSCRTSKHSWLHDQYGLRERLRHRAPDHPRTVSPAHYHIYLPSTSTDSRHNSLALTFSLIEPNNSP